MKDDLVDGSGFVSIGEVGSVIVTDPDVNLNVKTIRHGLWLNIQVDFDDEDLEGGVCSPKEWANFWCESYGDKDNFGFDGLALVAIFDKGTNIEDVIEWAICFQQEAGFTSCPKCYDPHDFWIAKQKNSDMSEYDFYLIPLNEDKDYDV